MVKKNDFDLEFLNEKQQKKVLIMFDDIRKITIEDVVFNFSEYILEKSEKIRHKIENAKSDESKKIMMSALMTIMSFEDFLEDQIEISELINIEYDKTTHA